MVVVFVFSGPHISNWTVGLYVHDVVAWQVNPSPEIVEASSVCLG
jgi:hypothetical protein